MCYVFLHGFPHFPTSAATTLKRAAAAGLTGARCPPTPHWGGIARGSCPTGQIRALPKSRLCLGPGSKPASVSNGARAPEASLPLLTTPRHTPAEAAAQPFVSPPPGAASTDPHRSLGRSPAPANAHQPRRPISCPRSRSRTTGLVQGTQAIR